WASMRGINTSKKSQMFRWRGVHEAHAAGAFFTRMEGKEHLAICPDCAVTESMEQIQLECEDGVHEIVWEIAKEIWEYAGERWPTLTYGLILRCGEAQVQNLETGRNRLFQKLLSEGSFLISGTRSELRRRATRVIDPQDKK
ncbi:hypothetical protein CPB85DRAFT_1233411, partial [Mucidula mucida]